MVFGNEGFKGGGRTSSVLKVLFDWAETSGDSAAGDGGCTEACVYVPGCGWRPEERAMI